MRAMDTACTTLEHQRPRDGASRFVAHKVEPYRAVCKEIRSRACLRERCTAVDFELWKSQ